MTDNNGHPGTIKAIQNSKDTRDIDHCEAERKTLPFLVGTDNSNDEKPHINNLPNGGQMVMFDAWDTHEKPSGIFSWEADFESAVITCTNIGENSATKESFLELLQKVDPRDTGKVQRYMSPENGTGRERIDFDVRLKVENEIHWHRVQGAAHALQNGGIFASGVAFDTDLMRGHTKQIEHLRTHDALSGLHNAQYFDSYVKSIEDKAIASHAIVLANIDGLKEINDTLGYYAGNKLIKNVAEVIDECFTGAEVVARIAGGEYCAVFLNKDTLEIEMIINEATHAIHRMYLNLIKTEVSFAYSIESGKFDFAKLYRNATARILRVKKVKRILDKKSVADPINDIIAQKTGWGKRSVRLQSLCAQIGVKMGCSDEYVREVKALAKIADIGLVALDDILLKNRRNLHGKKRMSYLSHVEHGRRLISSFPELADFEIPYMDVYKRYDEWQEGLSLASRIVAVAMCIDDVMIDNDGMRIERVRTALERERGAKYCPQVSDAVIGEMEHLKFIR